MLPINAQPHTDSGPALRKSPQANDIKILLLRHTNDVPRYCTSGARPSMLAILHLPSLEQYGSHYINPAKRPLLIRSNPLIQTCPIDHGKSFNKHNLSNFSLFCFETLPRSMCAFSLYSLNLKKQGRGGHSFAISLHGFTRGHPARHYLSLDWRRCTIRPVQQNHGIKVTVTAPKEDNNRKNKCHLTGRSFQIKWTACPLVLVTEYMLRFMGVLRRKSTTAKHRTTLHRSVFERWLTSNAQLCCLLSTRAVRTVGDAGDKCKTPTCCSREGFGVSRTKSGRAESIGKQEQLQFLSKRKRGGREGTTISTRNSPTTGDAKETFFEEKKRREGKKK